MVGDEEGQVPGNMMDALPSRPLREEPSNNYIAQVVSVTNTNRMMSRDSATEIKTVTITRLLCSPLLMAYSRVLHHARRKSTQKHD